MADARQLSILKQGSAAWNEWRRSHGHANINLRRACLQGLNLAGADLSGANLSHVDLSQADLTGAELLGANLSAAVLSGADLKNADLACADLSHAKLDQVNLSGACFEATTMAAVDLSQTLGLDMVRHTGPSKISLDTFFRSKGRIPQIFLEQAGVPMVCLTPPEGILDEPIPAGLGR
jgi:hypothetical protein